MPKIGNAQEKETSRLKRQILRSGFPLQIEIASSLSRHFSEGQGDISTSAYYLDKDEKKGRELDINLDFMIEPQKEESPILFLHLLIECKNIPGNAWVFFKSPHKVFPSVNSTSVLDALKWSPREHVTFTFIKNLHFWRIPASTVYQEFVMDKRTSNNRKDNLFDAVISLAKATSYELESSRSGFENLIQTEELLDLDYIDIFYGAIVFNGKIYVASEVEKGDQMQLTPVNHVSSYVDYVSGSYKIGLVIDIVHKKAFEKFVKMILNDIDLLREASDSDVGKKFNEELFKARRWYMSKDSGISVA